MSKSIFGEVVRGLGGIAGEITRQITGSKPKKHRKEFYNLKRYTVEELTANARHIAQLAKEARKK